MVPSNLLVIILDLTLSQVPALDILPLALKPVSQPVIQIQYLGNIRRG